MKNDFCDLSQREIHDLKIPDEVKGFLLSPFQFSQENGFVYVPIESFKELIGLITAHAKALDSQANPDNKSHQSAAVAA